MLEEMINSVIDKRIPARFPHIQFPGVVKARITDAEFDYSLSWHKYTLRILDKNDVIDENFPEIPDVFSKCRVDKGASVAIALLNGELEPIILAEVK